MRILLAEDDRAVRITVRDALQDAGFQVADFADGSAALAAMRGEAFDLLLSDIRLPGVDGITLFREARALQPECAAILMTAFGKVEDAVAVMREGAQDYITKPFEIDELVLRVERIRGELAFRSTMARPEQAPVAEADRMVGTSTAMEGVRKRIEAAAQAGVNVLITGETGTGKELCARTLHQRGARSGRPFVTVNCAAIPSELFEAEMFGHEKGAFTGAVKRRDGKMKAADGGTLFLDEVGELNLDHQAKLLRAIESGTFEPVGSNQSVKVDVWLISATNRDLREHVAARQFRQDLFYRLDVIEIHMPPLRERRSDIPLVVSDVLREACARRGAAMPGLSPQAMGALMAYEYPGNVRELVHAIEHGLALAQGKEIGVEHLPAAFHGYAALPRSGEQIMPLSDAARQFEQAYIKRVLDQVGGRRGEAAKLLGISRKSLWQKLKDEE